MSLRTARPPLLLLVILSCLPTGSRSPGESASLQPTQPAQIQHFTSAHLDSVATRPAEAARPAQLLGDRGGYSYLFIRRVSPGEVEVHTAWDDVFVVRTGSGTLLTGSTAEGGRDTGPGERRGGHIPEPRSRALRSGDLVVIPAGLAHQVVPDGDEALTYLVVKASARAR